MQHLACPSLHPLFTLGANPFEHQDFFVIALDFSKVFHTVKHFKIAEKLSYLDPAASKCLHLCDRIPDRPHTVYKIQRCRVSFQSDYGKRHSRLWSGTVCVLRNSFRSLPDNRRKQYIQICHSLVIPAPNAHTRERELEHIQH